MDRLCKIGDYWLFQGRDSKGYFYNLSKDIYQTSESGYYNLKTLLASKNLTKGTN